MDENRGHHRGQPQKPLYQSVVKQWRPQKPLYRFVVLRFVVMVRHGVKFFLLQKKKNPYIFKITAVEIFSKSHFFSILQHYNAAAHRETINKSRYVTAMAIIFIHGQANQKVATNTDKFVSIILDSSILNHRSVFAYMLMIMKSTQWKDNHDQPFIFLENPLAHSTLKSHPFRQAKWYVCF